MLSGVPLSTVTVTAEKFNTAVELIVQDVLRVIINSFVLHIIIIIIIIIVVVLQVRNDNT